MTEVNQWKWTNAWTEQAKLNLLKVVQRERIGVQRTLLIITDNEFRCLLLVRAWLRNAMELEAHLGVASPLGSRRYVRGVCEVDFCGALEKALELVLVAVAIDH